MFFMYFVNRTQQDAHKAKTNNQENKRKGKKIDKPKGE